MNEARLAADLGELAVDYSDAQLKDLRIGTLLTIGIMTASLVVGSSIVMTVEGGPTVFGVSLLTYCGLVGYLIAFVNSLWVILSIWRSGRR